MHWNLRNQEKSQNISKLLSVQFQKYKNNPNPLFKALVSTTKGSYKLYYLLRCLLGLFLWTLFLKFISGLLDYSGPFLLREIIDYTISQERDFSKGVLLVLGVIVSRIFIALINCRADILLVKPSLTFFRLF